MSDAPPALRDERYAVVRKLGEGGQAATFEAVDKRDGRLVVLKRFRVRGARSWKEVELAEREARVLASLDHPLLPRYVEHFEEGGELYLVTRKIEGESLAELRKRGGSLEPDEVVRFLGDASAALDYLHGRAPPVIHRDIKPGNVIRRPDGSFALIDFGSVRDRLRPEGGSTVVGTFGYMAPEQFQGRAMPASDVYAVATTALVMLTGREPEDLPHRGLAIDVQASLGAARVSPGLAKALSAMLDPNPDVRASRIAPLLAELRRPSAPSYRPAARSFRPDRPARPDRPSRSSRRERRGRGWLPWPFQLALTLVLTAVQVALVLALQVAVPLVLALLSLLFGKGLRKAAGQVREAGKAGSESVGRARDRVASAGRGRRDEEGAPGQRIAEPGRAEDPGVRARVADGDDAEAAAEEEAEDEARRAERKGRRRR